MAQSVKSLLAVPPFHTEVPAQIPVTPHYSCLCLGRQQNIPSTFLLAITWMDCRVPGCNLAQTSYRSHLWSEQAARRSLSPSLLLSLSPSLTHTGFHGAWGLWAEACPSLAHWVSAVSPEGRVPSHESLFSAAVDPTFPAVCGSCLSSPQFSTVLEIVTGDSTFLLHLGVSHSRLVILTQGWAIIPLYLKGYRLGLVIFPLKINRPSA